MARYSLLIIDPLGGKRILLPVERVEYVNVFYKRNAHKCTPARVGVHLCFPNIKVPNATPSIAKEETEARMIV